MHGMNLEALNIARENLISRGIQSPSKEQITTEYQRMQDADTKPRISLKHNPTEVSRMIRDILQGATT
jgi:hypothetical protein